MVTSYAQKMEKVTFNMPIELKKKVLKLSDEMHTSLSSIYNEAIEEYIKNKELERWNRGIEIALNDKEYLSDAIEFASDRGDMYEY